MTRIARRNAVNVLSTCFALLCIVLLVPYLRYTAYQTEAAKPFSGDHWYNPYADVTDTLLRANFHAHSKAWAGITWGEHTAEEVITAYTARGYQIPALSNYHKITPRTLYPDPLIHIPVYEHGYNLKKVHCLCIGAKDISYFDYPLHLSINHTQHIIHNLRKMCDLVALAHPGARNAHEPEDMVLLDGLQLMEVANTQGANTQYWDAILSHGSVTWFLANDDMHALDDGEAFMRWNMIYVESYSAEAAIASMTRGNHYGVLSYGGNCSDNRLREFAIDGDTLRIALRDTFNRLDIIGQNGVLKSSIARNTSGRYLLQDDDTYIRIEVHQDQCVLYLNPIMRYAGASPPYEKRPAQSIDSAKTWIGRLLFSLMIGLIVYAWVCILRRRP